MAETARQKRITGRPSGFTEIGALEMATPAKDPNPNPTQPPIPPDMPPSHEPTGIPQPGPDSVPTPNEPLPIPPGSPPEMRRNNRAVGKPASLSAHEARDRGRGFTLVPIQER